MVLEFSGGTATVNCCDLNPDRIWASHNNFDSRDAKFWDKVMSETTRFSVKLTICVLGQESYGTVMFPYRTAACRLAGFRISKARNPRRGLRIPSFSKNLLPVHHLSNYVGSAPRKVRVTGVDRLDLV